MKGYTVSEKMEILLSYAAKIAETKELDALLYEIATMGKLLIGADRSTVWLIDEEKNVLWTKVAHGIPKIEIPLETGVVGETVKKGKIIISNHPYSLPYFNRDVDKSTGYTTKSLLTIPLLNEQGNVFGAFQCVNKLVGSREFDDEDVKLLQLVAGYAQKSLLTTILSNEIERTQIEVIVLMAEIGESRSHETGNHVKRVAAISTLLAEKCNLGAEKRKLIEVSSPMHDIGKVAIPDSILNKPGKLTQEEYDLMKNHTTIGYQLLNTSKRPIIKTAAIIAHEHHEKWNGKGYPRGIAGEEIDILARITAIADVFDALSSKRCYKEAWELSRVYAFFKEERGEHFDPHLVDVFLEHFDEFAKILDEFKD